MLTIQGVLGAERLVRELLDVREAMKALREDSSKRVRPMVHDLARTYGTDRAKATCVVQKSRYLAMLADEEAEIVTLLRALGVDARDAAPPATPEDDHG